MSVELMGKPDLGRKQFKTPDSREGTKKVETEEVPDYQDVLNKLISKKEQFLAHQDELSKARFAIRGEKFTGDSVVQFKQNLESYKKWGLEPNFAGDKTLVPYKIENDNASKNNKLNNEPYMNIKEVDQARLKMEKMMSEIGLNLGGSLKKLAGFEREATDHTQFANDEKGKALYNLQIKYGNLLQLGVKEDVIKSILTTEAKKMGLI